MRSSVLAEEAISRKLECIFVGRISGLDWVSERISNLGFSRVIEDERFFDVDRESDVLVLDSYSIPVSNQFIAKDNWSLVLSICDAVTPRYQCDLELRPGLEDVETGNGETRILSGAMHILIRKGIEKSKKEISPGDVTKVLVMGGGADPFRFVESIVDSLKSMGVSLLVHAFTDGQISNHSSVHVVSHPLGSNLDLIAKDVDVVFTTASTSCFEFIAREIPTGIVCAVDNQADYFDQLGRLGYAAQLGVYNSNCGWEFDLPSIKEMLESPKKRQSLKEVTKSLIDLKGAARVVDAMVLLAARTKN